MTAARMHSRWGSGVTASFVLFILGVLVMMFISISERVDLVSDRYYDQGLRYQERIEARKNSAGAGGVRVAVLRDAVLLEFPRPVPSRAITGTIFFYRPADGSRDFTVGLTTDSLGNQVVPTASLDRGLWRVKAEWTVEGVVHYDEQPVMIP